MSAADAGMVLSVPRKRWLRCYILHTFISSIMWLLLGSSIASFWPWSLKSSLRLPFSQRFLRFLSFVASQIIFLLGEAVVTHPEDKDAASAVDIFCGVLKLAWRAVVGAPLDRDGDLDAAALTRKLQTSRDRTLFVFLCSISGSFAIISLTWSSPSHLSAKEEACRGAALGLLYAVWHLYRKRMILIFPIIQRPAFFNFKLGFTRIIRTSFKLALISVPFAELAIIILNSSTLAADGTKNSQRSFFIRELDFVVLAAFTAVLWEMSHHLVQTLHTRRYKFAPLFGTSAAETSPSEMLLIALEETEKSSLPHYLATLDLCMLSESNSDPWRLHALFEESGETYSRVVSTCLKPLNMLTMKLAKGLDGSSEVYKKDSLKQQMQIPGQESVPPAYQILHDQQLCSWCARTIASLTSFSKNNDRYGVAQLRGCNGAVVSSLLSCLLVIEVYLGRRSSTQPGQMIGVNSIKWTVPSRGPVPDSGRKQGFPFPKRSELHKKAHAMADVLRTSLYQIVTTFREEMVLNRPGGVAIAEKDWLDKGQPLYGTRELHVQSLRLLLDFRM
eukprot:c16184_g1_i1 orf=644-2320(+)